MAKCNDCPTPDTCDRYGCQFIRPYIMLQKQVELCGKIKTFQLQNNLMLPKIVTLCGSTKFKDDFFKANERLTLLGYIVLSVGFFMHSDSRSIEPQVKEQLDDLHKRKIDISDSIFVLNVGGYIGESTQSEITYALSQGKDVEYLEPVDEYVNIKERTTLVMAFQS